jgi:IS30 family transposase
MGHHQAEIAKFIGVDKSTIRRKQGQRRIWSETWALVEAKTRMDWSPEQISGWLLRYYQVQVSHEWIYQFILSDKQTGGDLYKHLRCQKKRCMRYGNRGRRGRLPNRRSIEERPEIVDHRQRIGDWEVDTMIGKGHQQAIVTLTE